MLQKYGGGRRIRFTPLTKFPNIWASQWSHQRVGA